MKKFNAALYTTLTLLFVIMLTSCNDLVDESNKVVEDIQDALGSFDDVEEEFQKIADRLGNDTLTVADDAQDVPNKIVTIIDTQTKDKDASDIMLLIDKTGSMSDDIDEIKKGVKDIIENLPPKTRLGIATYGDKNTDGEEWFSMKDLTTNHDSVKTIMNAVTTTGGGDWPESVFDGIYKVMDESSWATGSYRLIIVIGDASPLTGDKSEHNLETLFTKARSTTPNLLVAPIIIHF